MKNAETVVYYTNQRHEAIWNSLEAKLFKIALQIIDSENQVSLERYWQYLTLESDEIPGRLEKETWYPHDFASKITRNFLSGLFEGKFQARRKLVYRTGEDGKKHKRTFYQFKPEVITIFCKKYNISNENGNSRGKGSGGGQLTLEKATNVNYVDNLFDEEQKLED